MKGFEIVAKTQKGEEALLKVILEDNLFLEKHKEKKDHKVFFAFFERIVEVKPPKYEIRLKNFHGLKKIIGSIINPSLLREQMREKIPMIKENGINSMKLEGAVEGRDFEVVIHE